MRGKRVRALDVEPDLPFDDQGVVPGAHQLDRKVPADVGLAEPAGQRALGAHRRAAAARQLRPRVQPGGEDELVVGTQRVGTGLQFAQQVVGDETPATEVLAIEGLVWMLAARAPAGQVDPQDPAFVTVGHRQPPAFAMPWGNGRCWPRRTGRHHRRTHKIRIGGRRINPDSAGSGRGLWKPGRSRSFGSGNFGSDGTRAGVVAGWRCRRPGRSDAAADSSSSARSVRARFPVARWRIYLGWICY